MKPQVWLVLHQDVLEEGAEAEDGLRVRGDLVQPEPEPQVHRLEGGVQLRRLVTHVAHRGREHAEPVKWNDPAEKNGNKPLNLIIIVVC